MKKNSLEAACLLGVALVFAGLPVSVRAASLSPDAQFRIRAYFGEALPASPSGSSGSGSGSSSGSGGGEVFSISFPPEVALDPSSLVFSATRALTAMPAPGMAWIEAPVDADAVFNLGDGVWHAPGDAPVEATAASVVQLSAVTPPARGQKFDITLHVGAYTAVWEASTLAENGVIFTSLPVLSAYTGQPYSYPVVAYSLNPAATLILESLLKPDWLTFTDNGDWTGMLSGIVPGVGGPAVAGDFPAFSTNGGMTANYGIAYSYDFEAAPASGLGLWMDYTAGSAWLRMRHMGTVNIPAYKPYGDVMADAGGTRVSQPTALLVLSGVAPWPTDFVDPIASGAAPGFSTSGGTTAQYGIAYAYDFEAASTKGLGVWTDYAVGPAWLRLRHMGTASVPGYKPHGDVMTDAGGTRVSQPTDLLRLSGVAPWPTDFVDPLVAGAVPSFSTSGGTSAQYGIRYTYDFEAASHAGLGLWTQYVAGPSWLRLRHTGTASVPGYKPYGDVMADAGGMQVAEPTAQIELSGVPPWPVPSEITGNSAPYFVAPTPSEGGTASVSSGFTLTIGAADDDDVDALVIEVTSPSSLPSGMVFAYDGNGSRTATITGTGVASGSYSFTITARDARGASVVRSFTIQVS